MDFYHSKDDAYFSHARREILEFLPSERHGHAHALEIGCAQGYTLEWLKGIGYCRHTCGVEPHAQVNIAQRKIDRFFALDVEKEFPAIAENSVDLMLCLDVLEHLVDPWGVLQKLTPLLRTGGRLILSLPNLRNYHVLFDLAFRGTFNYTHAGILDKTHLRFFTRSSAIELAACSGLTVSHVKATGMHRWQKKLLCAIGLEELISQQYLLIADKA